MMAATMRGPVDTGRPTPPPPTFLQWCAVRRAQGKPVWGCGMRAFRLYLSEIRGR